MNKILNLPILIIFLTGCATIPAIDPNDIVSAPQMAKNLENELAKIISPSSCNILGCVNLKSDPNHFICTGEFSVILSYMAQEKFQTAASKVISKDTKIDFTAEEGLGSHMLSAFLGGVGGGLAASATGGGSNYYPVGASSAPVQFSLPEKSELK